jgi:hypothetical protein
MRRNEGRSGQPTTCPAAVQAYSFPRTPHICGSSVADDDRMLAQEDLDTLCRSCEVVLQEKVDGTNVGIFFQSAGQPVCQKRAGLLAGRERQQYNVFRNWVWERVEELWSLLGTRWVLFGEWLWQTHATYYDALPSFLVAVDLLDRASGRFSTSVVVKETVSEVVELVPDLWRGHVGSAEELSSLIPPFLVRAASANALPEGVYIRFERRGDLVARAKCRRPGFTPVWNGRPRPNQLTDSWDSARR